MAHETQILWVVFLGIGAAVLGVVILLLGLLRESVKSLGALVAAVWSSAVGVFVHTVTAAPQLEKAGTTLRTMREDAA
jgi:flagellar motor component MotA